MRYLLDASFAIEYLRARPEATARMERLLADGDEVYLNDVVVCELMSGARPGEELALAAFIRAAEFVQPGPEVAAMAGRFRAGARRSGRGLGVPDALIAACADALAATVLTMNARDFALTPVPIETY